MSSACLTISTDVFKVRSVISSNLLESSLSLMPTTSLSRLFSVSVHWSHNSLLIHRVHGWTSLPFPLAFVCVGKSTPSRGWCSVSGWNSHWTCLARHQSLFMLVSLEHERVEYVFCLWSHGIYEGTHLYLAIILRELRGHPVPQRWSLWVGRIWPFLYLHYFWHNVK